MADTVQSTIRFVTDATQALGPMKAIAAEARAVAAVIDQANRSVLSQRSGISDLTGGAGVTKNMPKPFQPFLANDITKIDQFNKTFRQTFDLVVQNGQKQEIFRSRVKDSFGDLDALVGATTRYGNAMRSADNAQSILTEGITEGTDAVRGIEGAFRSASAAQVQGLRTQRETIKQNLADLRAYRAQIDTPGFRPRDPATGAFIARDVERARVDSEIAEQSRNLRRNAASIGRETINVNRLLANDPALQLARQRLQGLLDLETPTSRAAASVAAAGLRSIENAYTRQAPLPTNIGTLQRESPQLMRRLLQQGMGRDAAGQFSVDELYKSGADGLRITRDLERQVTHVTGAWRDHTGAMVNVNAAYREGGQVVTRFGGALSGANNFMRQTVNNLQKVVQWGVATTLVFGGLATAISALDNLVELNKLLTQFSITAQMSAGQTGEMFNELAQVAYNTATPLNELVKAADDMALSTRRNGQTMEEWRGSILEVANSVGILTNITGLDTVRATDLLTSTMKQLNLESTDLVGLLNKVTAVAGGQAGSIQDIVAGLGAMAEASEQAGLSIDETIGTVQILGQVTSKSSTEVATAFKNLVGSVDARAARKAFEEYNISIKDSEGNLRNILDIYGEVQDKIRTGVIPEGDVKALVRAMAGGPRRAPDAAALLANIDSIQAATDRSEQATNEALVANARYLDTIAAKIEQVQVRFAQFIQNSFGPAAQTFVGDLANLLNGLLDAVEGLDGGMIEGALRAIAFLSALTLLTKGAKLLGGGLNDIIKLIRSMQLGNPFLPLALGATQSSRAVIAATASEIAAIDKLIVEYGRLAASARASGNIREAEAFETAAAVQQAQRAELSGSLVAGGANDPNRRSRFGSFVGRYGGVASGAALGAGISAATGQNFAGIAGGGLMGAGLGLLTAPVPIPHAKVAGLALTALGGAMQLFTGATEDNTQAIKENNQELLNSLQAYDSAQFDLAALAEQQQLAAEDYKRLTADPETREDNQMAANESLRKYGELAAEIYATNEKLEESYRSLDEAAGLPGLASQLERIRTTNQLGLPTDQFTAESMASVRQRLFDNIFKESYPNYTPIDDATQNLIKPSVISTQIELDGDSVVQFRRDVEETVYAADYAISGALETKTVSQVFDLDLQNLGEAQRIMEIFTAEGEFAAENFEFTAENIDSVRHNLQLTVEAGGDLAGVASIALQNFNEIVNSLSIIDQANLFAAQQATLLETRSLIGEISAETKATAEENLATYLRLAQIADSLPVSDADRQASRGPRFGPEVTTREDVQRFAQENLIDDEGLISGEAANVETARQYLELIDSVNGQKKISGDLGKEVRDLTEEEVAVLAAAHGLQVEYNSAKQGEVIINDEILEQQEEMTKNIAEFGAKTIDSAAQKLADLQAGLQAGEFEDEQLPGVNRQIEQLEAVIGVAGRVSETYQELSNDYIDLDLVMDEFAAQLTDITGLQNAESLTTDQLIAKLFTLAETYGLTGDQVIALGDKLILLEETVRRIAEIKAQFKIEAVVDTERAIKVLETLFAASQLRYNGQVIPGSGDQSILDAINQLKAASAALEPIADDIKTGFEQGDRSQIGAQSGSTKEPKGPDYSTVEVPDDYEGNTSKLISQAVALARQLQSQLPGADEEAKDDVISIIDGFNKIMEVRGVDSGLLSKAMNYIIGGKLAEDVKPDINELDLPEEIAKAANRTDIINQAIAKARELQATIPGAEEEARNDIVSILNGTQNLLQVRGVREDLLRRALEELADIEKKRLDFETKADQIRRIRVGAGDFAAIANVPVNTRTGVSLGGAQGPINVTLNLNGTVLTPAQFNLFADQVAAALKRQLAGG